MSGVAKSTQSNFTELTSKSRVSREGSSVPESSRGRQQSSSTGGASLQKDSSTSSLVVRRNRRLRTLPVKATLRIWAPWLFNDLACAGPSQKQPSIVRAPDESHREIRRSPGLCPSLPLVLVLESFLLFPRSGQQLLPSFSYPSSKSSQIVAVSS